MNATGMPSRLAISLSWLVACSFLPSSVFSNTRYCSSTSAAVMTRMAQYWLSMNTPPSSKPGSSNRPGSTCGLGPYAASTVLASRMDAPIVLMITGICPRCRSGQYTAPGEQHAERGHQRHRHRDRDEVRHAPVVGQQHHGVGAQHGELALREVHHPGGADQQHEAQADQRVDAADAEAREQQLQEDGHAGKSIRRS